jgi:GTP-binding protein LepA
VIVTYELPFAEVLFDFHDKLKSISRGYASMDYELVGFRADDLGQGRHPRQRRTARRSLHHRPQGQELRTRPRTRREAQGVRPRQQYEVAIQAAIGGKIIASETVKAIRKDVTAKCYGGDISRKRKLLEKQKEGKKRMKQVGASRSPAGVPGHPEGRWITSILLAVALGSKLRSGR